MATGREIAEQILEERDRAAADRREPFIVAISSAEAADLRRYFGDGHPGPDVWPAVIAGVPIQVLDYCGRPHCRRFTDHGFIVGEGEPGIVYCKGCGAGRDASGGYFSRAAGPRYGEPLEV